MKDDWCWWITKEKSGRGKVPAPVLAFEKKAPKYLVFRVTTIE